MRAKRGEQGRREIGVETKIFLQFRQTEIFRPHVRAAEPKRRFAPMIDAEHGIKLLIEDVPGGIVMDHFRRLQFPASCFRMINGTVGQIIGHDVVVLILLQYLHGIELVAPDAKILDEPGPRVGPVAKNLALDQRGRLSASVGKEMPAREFGMRRQRIVQRHRRADREQTNCDQRQEDPWQTDTGSQHGDNLIRARHSAQ